MSKDWVSDVYSTIKGIGVSQVAYVPDAGHSQLIKLCDADPDIHSVSLTTEEEGVAMLGGAWLGGQKAMMLIQSSGVGNCINMLALIQECRMPFLAIVTMRGEWGEFNPWQCPMGQSTQRALENSGVFVIRADDANEIPETVRAGALLAFNSNRSVAILISQKILGIKDFNK